MYSWRMTFLGMMKYLSLSMARLWELNLNLHKTDLSDLFVKESTYGACSPILCINYNW